MARQTIDFGIDLGTTNSAVAVLEGTRTEVIKNNLNLECTPSVVWIDKADRIQVGANAKERLFNDPENAVGEFKLEMGRDRPYAFKRGGRRLQPEELSSEILKSLRAIVKHRMGEDIEAAVVTVPADFDSPETAATNKAAQLAGLRQCPLLQEPIAAALCYGFQASTNKVFWLVYDFGGGTFDAAVIQLRDGQIEVVNHGGDKQLGGKNIDWDIVDKLLVPAVTREHSLPDFNRGNPRWMGAFSKLKQEAEKCKILLSQAQSAEIIIELLCQDERGGSVGLECELARRDIEAIVEPYVERSVNICRRVLEEKRLASGMIERLILVGGPTLTPALRARLSDKTRGLGIPLDFTQDPMTVVARGAAIFAGNHKLERTALSAAPAGAAALELVYDPIVREQEPSVGGRVALAGGRSPAGFTIEFVNPESKPPWRSGKVAVEANGSFMTTLWADEGRRNSFLIELCDPSGAQVPAEPGTIQITLGNRPGAAPVTHSLGVGMANGETDVFISKGAALPVRKRLVHRNVREVRRGAAGNLLRIQLLEGESRRNERNRLIGYIEIPAQGIPRDLPAQSDIEITIEIDASRAVKARAYIPVLDREFEKILDLRKPNISAKELAEPVAEVRRRLGELRERLEGSEGESAGGEARRKAQEVLSRVERENVEQNISQALEAAGNDPNAADKCHQRVLDLHLALDELEASLLWPDLLKEAENALADMRETADNLGKRRQDREGRAALEKELKSAIESRDPALLKVKIVDVKRFRWSLEATQPRFWLDHLSWLEDRRGEMRDTRRAEELFTQARRAAEADNLDALKGAVNQLYGLLPEETKATSPFGGGTIR